MGNAVETEGSIRIYPVHPHVHGERIEHHGEQRSHDGSSPRTWGTHIRGVQLLLLKRFIPTYMGNAKI